MYCNRAIVPGLFLCVVPALAQPPSTPPGAIGMLKAMDAQFPHFAGVSREIWGFAELGYKEVRSCALLKQELKKAGFVLEENVGEIPTAFIASWGEGSPVIGLIGEYDALPGVSQQAVPERMPIVPNGPGHACGHNLLGTASAFAAIAVKNYLQSHKVRGTVVFYGAPAEEGGGGKVFMARAGVFNRADIVLTWHPGASNYAWNGTSLANINAHFRFHGTASHAAGAPEAGRSALDAELLMFHCVELLREHVKQDTRIHYIVTNGGGSPNVVPPFAEAFLYARQRDMNYLDEVWGRIGKCAQAGALGAGVRHEIVINAAVYNLLPNPTLAGLLDKNLRAIGGVTWDEDEMAFARKIHATFEHPADKLDSIGEVAPINTAAVNISTDVADVSWNVPVGQISTVTWVPGTPGHSWQSAAAAGMSIGQKGMLLAAKTLAASAVELYHSPRIVAAAKTDFDRARGGREYRSLIPAASRPPLRYRDAGNP